jgi:hypothetical protein
MPRLCSNLHAMRPAALLAGDHEQLRCYMGESAFNAMTKVYIARHPSGQPNPCWHMRHLPEFLAGNLPYSRAPELAELARLGRALNEAFDAADAPVVRFVDLAALAPENFGTAVFDIHPSTRRLRVTTNVTGLWSSLKCDEAPPKPCRLAAPQEILVWRQDGSPRFRLLGNEEAVAIDAAAEGAPFAVICEKIAAMDDPGSAALRATGYLRGWIEAQAVSRIRLAAAAPEK